ncbi:MAG: DUF5053 domain-containing protein [Chitinophagaceae bacterium]
MKLKKQLEKLANCTTPEDAKKQLAVIKQNFTSEEDKKHIVAFMKDLAVKQKEKGKQDIEEISLKIKLAEVSEIVSLSYIAKKYFNKQRTWLYQRINGNIVNGKEANFNDTEIKTLNFALKDISKKLSTISI